MKIREFIECPDLDCETKMRFDEVDQDYYCANCGMMVKPVVTDNVKMYMADKGDTIPFTIGEKPTLSEESK